MLALVNSEPVVQIPGRIASVLGQQLLFEAGGAGRLKVGETAMCIVGEPGERTITKVRYVRVRENAMVLELLQPWREFAACSEERYRADIAARLSGPNLPEPLEATVVNISTGGVAIRVDSDLPGSFCELALGVDDFRTCFPCRILEKGPDEAGNVHLQYLDLQPAQRQLLRRVTAALRGSEEAQLEPDMHQRSTAPRSKRRSKQGAWSQARSRLRENDGGGEPRGTPASPA